MTDDELRAIGQEFIDSRRKLLSENPWNLDAETVRLGNERWTYVDPLRMGVYVLTMNGTRGGVWAVDFDHIAKVCTNAVAFAVKPPEGSAHITDMNTAVPPDTSLQTVDGASADCVTAESFLPG